MTQKELENLTEVKDKIGFFVDPEDCFVVDSNDFTSYLICYKDGVRVKVKTGLTIIPPIANVGEVMEEV